MENNYIIINYNNNEEYLLQYNEESTNQFSKRIEFINKLKKLNINWNDALNLSKIWYCITFKKCKYKNEIYNYIKKIDN
jgi:hypothetical protein